MDNKIFNVVLKNGEYYYLADSYSCQKIVIDIKKIVTTYGSFGGIRLYKKDVPYIWDNVKNNGNHDATFDLTLDNKIITSGTFSFTGSIYPYSSYKALSNEETMVNYPNYALATGVSKIEITFQNTVELDQIGFGVHPDSGNGSVSMIALSLDNKQIGEYELNPTSAVQQRWKVTAKSGEIEKIL